VPRYNVREQLYPRCKGLRPRTAIA
jgi:hypothetical protein